MKQDDEDIKLLKEMQRWHEEIEKDCKYKKEHNILSVPPLLSLCKITDDICDFNNCPKRQKNKKEDDVV